MLINYYYCDCYSLCRAVSSDLGRFPWLSSTETMLIKNQKPESLCISRIRKARIFCAWEESAPTRSPLSHKRHLLRLISHKHTCIHTERHTHMRFTGRRGGSKSRGKKKKKTITRATSGPRRGTFFLRAPETREKNHYQSVEKNKKKKLTNTQSSATNSVDNFFISRFIRRC